MATHFIFEDGDVTTADLDAEVDAERTQVDTSNVEVDTLGYKASILGIAYDSTTGIISFNGSYYDDDISEDTAQQTTAKFKLTQLDSIAFDDEDLVFYDVDGSTIATLTGIKSALELDQVSNYSYDDLPLSSAATAALAGKQGTETGKGLSEEDFTTELKTKLENLDSPLAYGYHDSVTALEASYTTTPRAGSYAFVLTEDSDGTSSYHRYVYDTTDDEWDDQGTSDSTTMSGEDMVTAINATDNYQVIEKTDAEKLDSVESGAQANTVETVNGQYPDDDKNVAIDANDIGLGNVDNTSDADKPVSTATAAAIEAAITEYDEGATGTVVNFLFPVLKSEFRTGTKKQVSFGPNDEFTIKFDNPESKYWSNQVIKHLRVRYYDGSGDTHQYVFAIESYNAKPNNESQSWNEHYIMDDDVDNWTQSIPIGHRGGAITDQGLWVNDNIDHISTDSWKNIGSTGVDGANGGSTMLYMIAHEQTNCDWIIWIDVHASYESNWVLFRGQYVYNT